MSRFSDYDYDYDPLEEGRWIRNSRVCVEGKPGQKALRQMEAALLALPAPRLIEGRLATEEGDVCAVGALIAYQQDPDHPAEAAKALAREEAEYLHNDYDDEWLNSHFTLETGQKAGLSQTLAYILGDLNDITLGGVAPEERYRRVLAWVRLRIK